jgi:hypothetical protein
MRVLVCGGRDYGNHRAKWPCNERDDHEAANVQNQVEQDTLRATLDTLDVSLVIAGGASGADKLAADFAKLRGIPLEEYPVTSYEWGKYGKRAGYLRNARMLAEGKPDLVVAFPGGRGTAMMVKLAKEAGVEVIQIGN